MFDAGFEKIFVPFEIKEEKYILDELRDRFCRLLGSRILWISCRFPDISFATGALPVTGFIFAMNGIYRLIDRTRKVNLI